MRSSLTTGCSRGVYGGQLFTGQENCVTNIIAIIIRRTWSEREEDLKAVRCWPYEGKILKSGGHVANEIHGSVLKVRQTEER